MTRNVATCNKAWHVVDLCEPPDMHHASFTGKDVNKKIYILYMILNIFLS